MAFVWTMRQSGKVSYCSFFTGFRNSGTHGEPTNRVRQDHQAVALHRPGFNLSDKPGEVSEYRIQGDRPLGMEAAQLIEIAR